jgi:hypothetical protein
VQNKQRQTKRPQNLKDKTPTMSSSKNPELINKAAPSPKRRASDSSSDTSEEEKATRRRNIEQLECQTTFNLALDRVNILETVASLLREYSRDDYYAYERGDEWHVGLGSRATLLVSPDGKTMTITTKHGRKVRAVDHPLADIAKEFVEQTNKLRGGKSEFL